MSATTEPAAAPTTQLPWRGRGIVVAATILAALGMLPAGVWMLGWPESFAEAVGFLPAHVHFEHDAGAFQVAIGLTLLLSLAWRDGFVLALTLFLVANTIHTINHALDLDLGGRTADAWSMGAVSVLVGVALWLRLRELDYVVGEVATATTPALAPFVRHKTALLTTYRRNGTPGSSPLSVAVDGDRAYIRSYETSLKTRRLRHNPEAELRPSTQRGKPTGPAIHARARALSGAESAHAALLLRRKHPFLHGDAVPFFHTTNRRKYGQTVHFELTPTPSRPHPKPQGLGLISLEVFAEVGGSCGGR